MQRVVTIIAWSSQNEEVEMSLIGMIKGKGSNGFGYDSTAEEVTAGLDLSGKRILITGSNSGLGLESARVLAKRGATILAAARTKEKAAKALEEIGAQGAPLACELSDPDSVRACVAAVKALGEPVDVILCNAGIMALPKREVRHGVELQLFTNHVGHFILVTGLLDLLAEDGRVVMLSSAAHRMAPREGIELDNLSGERGYRAWRAYGQSKLANLLFAMALAQRFEGTKKTANALHPGVIQTNLGRHMGAFSVATMKAASKTFFKTIPQGAATQCYLAAHPDAAKFNGRYFADSNPVKPKHRAATMEKAEALWSATEALGAVDIFSQRPRKP